MAYAIVFVLLAGGLTVLAVALWPAGVIILGPVASFLGLTLAYALRRPELLGKRPDGRIAWWAYLPFGPYFLLNALLWHLVRVTGTEPAAQQITPGIWVGRRLLAGELPAGVTKVVDLAAEFPVASRLVGDRKYVSFPMLDATSPRSEEFAGFVAALAAEPDTVFIHCALGHGRTGLVAAALLIGQGMAEDPRSALRLIRSVRPKVRLSPSQWEALRRWSARCPNPSPRMPATPEGRE